MIGFTRFSAERQRCNALIARLQDKSGDMYLLKPLQLIS